MGTHAPTTMFFCRFSAEVESSARLQDLADIPDKTWARDVQVSLVSAELQGRGYTKYTLRGWAMSEDPENVRCYLSTWSNLLVHVSVTRHKNTEN